MAQLSDFDEIRPYSDSEVAGAIRELLADRQFRAVVRSLVPWLPYSVAKALMRLALMGVDSTLSFQARLMRPVAKYILARHSAGYKLDAHHVEPNRPDAHHVEPNRPTAASRPDAKENITPDKCYTFVSNHRDIVLDISIFNLMLYEHEAHTTCEVAIGDNLLIYPWIERLVRLNKCFIVRRSLPPREFLKSSILMSQYMHFVISEKHENIWIAQREGRAKDSSDNTQESVIKMLTLGDTSTPMDSEHKNVAPIDSLRELNVVPLTVNYEYDPCDFLKAKEFQLKRDNPHYKKTRQDDLTNMSTGIFGHKGRIVFRTAQCINEWLDELRGLEHNDFFREVALRMDKVIHSNYELFPNNYIAHDLLSGKRDFASHYTPEDERHFEDYLAGQIAKIDLEEKDNAFLRERILTMYANPLRNYLIATNNKQQ